MCLHKLLEITTLIRFVLQTHTFYGNEWKLLNLKFNKVFLRIIKSNKVSRSPSNSYQSLPCIVCVIQNAMFIKNKTTTV
jgi:hypothetical protein